MEKCFIPLLCEKCLGRRHFFFSFFFPSDRFFFFCLLKKKNSSSLTFSLHLVSHFQRNKYICGENLYFFYVQKLKFEPQKVFSCWNKILFLSFFRKNITEDRSNKSFLKYYSLEKNFFLFFFCDFQQFLFQQKKKSCLEKEYKTFRRKVFMLYFFLCQNFLTTSFQETECCFLISIVEKHVFPEKSPKKVQLTKHLFLTWFLEIFFT